MFDSSNMQKPGGRAILYQGGEVVAGATIIRRAGDASNYLRWWVRLPCGCEVIREGAILRKFAKAGEPASCSTHRRKPLKPAVAFEDMKIAVPSPKDE